MVKITYTHFYFCIVAVINWLVTKKCTYIHTLITSTYIYDDIIDFLITTPLLEKSVFVIQVKVLYSPVNVTLARHGKTEV